jgi:hypothetical protein
MNSQVRSDDLSEWDWPPVSYAENDHILVWWLPEYDDMLRRLVDEYQWVWQSLVLGELQSKVPETVVSAWREVDPLCRDYAWRNVLWVFVAARAKQLGIRPRQPDPPRHAGPAHVRTPTTPPRKQTQEHVQNTKGATPQKDRNT